MHSNIVQVNAFRLPITELVIDRYGLFQKAMLTADAYVAAGRPDSAGITLEALKAATPAGPGQDRIQQAINRLPRS